MSDKTAVKVDIWSDIACPFCYIGKRNFESALALADFPIEVEFRSYQLAPDAESGSAASHAEHLANKLGVTEEQARSMQMQLTAAGRAVGLTFDYQRLTQTNTFDAHRLLHLAKSHGVQRQMKERLFAAYFTEGRDIGGVDELTDLAIDVGLDRESVLASLQSNAYSEEVESDRNTAVDLGISGVPFFVFAGKYAVSGAQEPAVFAQALERARQEQVANSTTR